MTWLARRLLAGLAILWAVATLTFLAVHLAPGEPLLPPSERPADPAVVAELRRQFGLDQPVPVQYVRYLANVATGNLGVSFSLRRPVARAIADALPHTLLLAAAALVVDFFFGVLLGVLQAARAGGRLDAAATTASLVVGALPAFWLALVLVWIFGEQLRWLPLGGAYDPALYSALPPLGQLADRLRHLVLPAATLGVIGAAGTARYQRTAMLDVLREDFVRTARAKGLPEHGVLRHALRNALLPSITLLGLSLPFLLTGAVLVETVFAWPGLGRLAADAIAARDYPLVTATALVATTAVVAGGLLADLLARAADPRITLTG